MCPIFAQDQFTYLLKAYIAVEEKPFVWILIFDLQQRTAVCFSIYSIHWHQINTKYVETIACVAINYKGNSGLHVYTP